MALRLYDTLTREKLPVLAMDGGVFRFYCCGPTVYGPAHIGNFRTFVMQADLNTADALGQLFTILKTLSTDLENDTLSSNKIDKIRVEFSEIMQAFGFTLSEPTSTKAPKDIEELAHRRWQAKTDRDWETADSIRKELTDAGWAVKDDNDSYQIAPL